MRSSPLPPLTGRWPATVLPALLAALLSLASPAAGQTAFMDADAAAIREVIEAQLAAFRRDDGAEAFSYAAPEIQAHFGTPERFMRMVREAYDPVYRPRQVFFQDLLVNGERWVQSLLVTAQDGRVLIALYTMERQPDASWRVGGVVLLPAQAQGV